MNKPQLSTRALTTLTIAGAFLIAFVVAIPQLFENLDARSIMVIQSPVDGTLTVHTDPGMKWQGFGKVTTYARRIQYSFSAPKVQGEPDMSIRTQFNDGGRAYLSGVVSWEMPLKNSDVIRLHKEFGSIEAIDQQLIRPQLEKVVFNVGPTMSSTESSAERRSEIPQSIDDQLQNGPYLTRTVQVTRKDVITGQDKNVAITEIVLDDKGQPKRASSSLIKGYSIGMSPVTVNAIAYDKVVEQQIAQRQQATTQVQISIANATKAAQDAITVEKQGEASAAEAKWKQEVIKAKEVTLAQQKLEVQTLAAKEAEQFKREQILRGEGEAERKRLVMAADGALDPKLKAYIEVNKAYAEAIGNYQGNWVPGVVMGNGGAGAGNGAQAMMEMLTVKAAKDLGLDMSIAGKGQTGKK